MIPLSLIRSQLGSVRCPTCGHSAAMAIGHCGDSSAHPATEHAAHLRGHHAALVAAGLITPAHRPRLDPTAARVVLPLRVHPATAAAIRADRRTGEGVGQVVDRWAVER